MADDHLSFDAADPVAEDNARHEQAMRRREDRDTFRRLMGDKSGRAFVFRLLDECHMRWDRRTPFQPGQPDATAYFLGMQAIGHYVMTFCEAVPDLYMQMLAEARNEDERVALVRSEEDRKRSDDNAAGIAMQGFDLPDPKNQPRHEG